MDRQALQSWVDYARKHHALLLIDNAYEAFITSPDVPHSIFEIPGAKECAIEFRSFSKTADLPAFAALTRSFPKQSKRS